MESGRRKEGIQSRFAGKADLSTGLISRVHVGTGLCVAKSGFRGTSFPARSLPSGIGTEICLGPQNNPVNKQGPPLPDLFQTGDFVLEQKDDARPAFLKDFSLQDRISRGSDIPTGACRPLPRFPAFTSKTSFTWSGTPRHGTCFSRSLLALCEKPRPEVTLFKTCFVFARSEGYPVVAHWLGQKKPREQLAIRQVLQQPVDKPLAQMRPSVRGGCDLNQFFARETDLLPVED
jgi:hypothetical protein